MSLSTNLASTNVGIVAVSIKNLGVFKTDPVQTERWQAKPYVKGERVVPPLVLAT